jgi:hypothetical protein
LDKLVDAATFASWVAVSGKSRMPKRSLSESGADRQSVYVVDNVISVVGVTEHTCEGLDHIFHGEKVCCRLSPDAKSRRCFSLSLVRCCLITARCLLSLIS